jgi:excisionase family DNA binding protein
MPKKPSAAIESDDERLLTLGELARYLHLGQKIVLDLVSDKKLPGTLIDKEWRFRRSAVDAWLDQQDAGDDDFEAAPDGMRIPLGDLMPDEAVIGDLHAGDALSVIEELAAHAYIHNWLNDKPWFVGAVIERESLASTAMEGGVAFLHTRSRDTRKIARPFIIVGRSYRGIDFGAPDGKPTFLFFLLGLKHDALHLPILGRLARVMRNPATIAKLRASSSSHEMRVVLIKQDAIALARNKATPVEYQALKPRLDRNVRLRAIMRLTAQRKQAARKARDEESRKLATEPAADAAPAKGKKATSAKAAAAKPAKKPASHPAKAGKPRAKKA